MASGSAAPRDRPRSWVLPSLVGLGAWITTGLGLSINLATDLLPQSWRDWAPYPWAVWSGALVLAFCAARTATAIQRHSVARAGEILPSGEPAGQGSRTVVVGPPDISPPATPILRHTWHDGEKIRTVEINSELVAIVWMQLQVDGGNDKGGGHDEPLG